MLTVVLLLGAVMLVLGILASIVNIALLIARPRRTIIIWYDDEDQI